MTTVEIIIAIIATISLLVSILSLIVSFFVARLHSKEHKRELKLFCTSEIVYDSLGRFGKLPRLLIHLRAVNSGFRPIELRTAGLKLNIGESYINAFVKSSSKQQLQAGLPHTLHDSEPLDIFFEVRDARYWLRKKKEELPRRKIYFTHAFTLDSEGREYRKKLTKEMIQNLSTYDDLDIAAEYILEHASEPEKIKEAMDLIAKAREEQAREES